MKRIIVISLSINLLLSLAGCRSITPSGSSSIFSSPSSEAQSAVSSEDPSAMTATNGTPENHITYLHYLKYYGVSYMKERVQILTGDGGMDWDVEEIVKNAPIGDSLKRYYVKDMYEQGTIPTVKDKYDHPALTNEFISSNGNWNFFPIKVRYEKYTLEKQPNKPEWDQYFMSRIKEESDVTPLIYVDAWLFDWNGDGIEDAFVNASNTFYEFEEDNVIPNPPFYDKTATYTLPVLFLSGNEPFETTGVVEGSITKKPLIEEWDEDEGECVSYNRLNQNIGEHFISAIQYDSKGKLMICPIYNSVEYNRAEEDEIMLSDIDGDGKSEFIIRESFLYGPIIVYKLIDGKPVEIFQVATSA